MEGTTIMEATMKYYADTNNELHGIDEGQDFLVQSDWNLLTDDELQARLAPTPEQILESKVSEAKAYLAGTDYKMTIDYFSTLDKDKQDEVTKLRAEAREFVRSNS